MDAQSPHSKRCLGLGCCLSESLKGFEKTSTIRKDVYLCETFIKASRTGFQLSIHYLGPAGLKESTQPRAPGAPPQNSLAETFHQSGQLEFRPQNNNNNNKMYRWPTVVSLFVSSRRAGMQECRNTPAGWLIFQKCCSKKLADYAFKRKIFLNMLSVGIQFAHYFRFGTCILTLSTLTAHFIEKVVRDLLMKKHLPNFID